MKNAIGIGIVGLILLLGGVWWSNTLSSSDSSVVSRNGIHWHPQLEIYVKGEKQDIPQNIGAVGVHSPIHTHDDLPLIHMEFGGNVTTDDTRVGNFFRIWGKEFNSGQLFDYRNGPEGRVRMFVNGEESTEFENYPMRDGDRIEIRFE